jgi:hypothetical protein
LKKYDGLWAAILYGVILCGFFWKTLWHFNTALLAGDHDIYQFVWAFWHFKNALLAGHNPFFTDAIFYPLHVSLILHVVVPIKSLMAALLLRFFSLIATYNILFIYTFVLAALGMYCLVKSFFKDVRIAFIAGFIFAFAPNQMGQTLSHFNVASVEAIPWILYLWKRQQDKPGAWKMAALSGLGAYLFLCDYQLFFYMVIATGCYLLFKAKESRAEAKMKILQIGRIFALFFVILLPFWWVVLTQLHAYHLLALHEPGWWATKIYCADLLSILIPSELHPWWGSAITKFYDSSFRIHEGQGVGYSNIFERNVTFGFVLLGVVVFGAVKYWKEKFIQFWFWTGLLFWILALGSVLFVKGVALNFNPHWPTKIIFPMPYMIHFLPVLNGMRIPARFTVISLVSVSLIVSFVLARLTSNPAITRKRKNLILAVLFAAVLFEFWPANHFYSRNAIPAIYDLIKNDGQKNHVVLDLPSPPWFYDLRPLYYQTYHEHKIVGGWTARVSREQEAYIKKYAELEKVSKGDADADPLRFREILEQLDVTYIVARGAAATASMERMGSRIPDLSLVRRDLTDEPMELWEFAKKSRITARLPGTNESGR